MLIEVWQMAEIVGLGVLQYKESAWCHEMRVEHKLGYLGEAWKIIGGICPHKLCRSAYGSEVAEHIAAHQRELAGASEQFSHFGNEAKLCGRFLYCGDTGCAARQ